MQENQNTIAKAAKKIIQQATTRWTPGSGIGSTVVECNINPYSKQCQEAMEEEEKTSKRIQYAALRAKSGQNQEVVESDRTNMSPNSKMVRRTGQFLLSAMGNFDGSNRANTGMIPDAELAQMGIDVNKIRNASGILMEKSNRANQERASLDTIADLDKRQAKEIELMIKYVSDPVVIGAVEELANQFINLNIVKLYENQPFFQDFCQGMKPTDAEIEKIKQSLTLAEAVVNGYGNTIQNLLTNFIDKIEIIMTRCNTLDPEIIARMRRLYINIKGIMVSKHLNATEVTALCKPDLDMKIAQQVALCKVSTDAKDALMKKQKEESDKQKEESDALHKRHMMFISLLVIVLIIVIVYFTMLKN